MRSIIANYGLEIGNKVENRRLLVRRNSITVFFGGLADESSAVLAVYVTAHDTGRVIAGHHWAEAALAANPRYFLFAHGFETAAYVKAEQGIGEI